MILHREGYVGKVDKLEASESNAPGASFPLLKIGLKYGNGRQPVIKNLKRISKPGLRVYKGSSELPVVLNNLGIAIVSTSLGLMTNSEARKKGVGGEVLCEIY